VIGRMVGRGRPLAAAAVVIRCRPMPRRATAGRGRPRPLVPASDRLDACRAPIPDSSPARRARRLPGLCSLVPTVVAIGVVAVVAGGSCSDGGAGADAAIDGVSPSCMAALDHSDLPWLQANVFTPSCAAFSSCHMGAALEAGGLSLEEGQTHPQLVGIDSDLFPQFKRVAAGDPASSYLLVILGQRTGPIDPDVGTMPYNNPLLCQQKRDAIERWVTRGALENEIDASIDAADDAAVDAGID